MGQSTPYAPAAPSEDQVTRMTDRLLDIADRMTDDQILGIADALHDQLRARRELRGRSHRRLDQRLHREPLNLVV